jgi:hypothetical protein
VLSALAFFIYFTVLRVKTYQDKKKAADIEVIFTQNLTFPAVTICNQNFFRLSAAHKHGIYDAIEDNYRALKEEHLRDAFKSGIYREEAGL